MKNIIIANRVDRNITNGAQASTAGQATLCNYANNYYGDQICLPCSAKPIIAK